ncbi:hypothetical protein [Paraclostridium sordellii]|uniref:hypothetical protein n=1 Tax=Paraclostridium sordellii TaxID=1505 RepID=UPI0005E85D78|nr:hypothetical protein [Paeniclostridium sordellii]CEP82662.1 Uncharacterised protein [[Clostridium] sordellii] [Paeniclostridium sordellii]
MMDLKIKGFSIVKNTKVEEVCRCYEHLVELDSDHFYCSQCKKFFTVAKKIKK